MSNSSPKPIPNDYIVVIRAGSKLRLLPNESLQIIAVINGTDALFTFRTRYVDEGFESSIPRELWIEARLKAETIDQAIIASTNMANFFTTIISFSSNGYSGPCQYHLAYESTPNLIERDYFTQFVEDERGLPNLSRRIPSESVVEVINKLAINQYSERIRRAIVQYNMGLSYWKRGEEILAVVHMYMGVEAIVPILRDQQMKMLGLDNTDDLALHYKINKKELDSHIRKEFIFRKDYDCHKEVLLVSNGFEHSYEEFEKIRPFAVQNCNKLAQYLRSTIIELLDLSPDTGTKLSTKPYSSPLGQEGYIRYLRGKLQSEHDNVAPPGQEYPIMHWVFGVKSFKLIDKDKVNISFNSSVTPQLGENVSFSPDKLEVYGPEGIMVETSSMGDVEITPSGEKIQPRTQQEFEEMIQEALANGEIEEIKIRMNDGKLLVITREETNSQI